MFVAVELPEDVRETAKETALVLARRLDRSVRLRWVSADQMHLTVRFIGHVPDNKVQAVVDAVESPLSMAPFDVEFEGCGVFPKAGPPRVLWIGLSQGLDALRAMHEEFNRRLAPLGYEAETRPFNAHLTLARIKEISSHAARQLRESVREVQPRSMQCRVSAATLFKSDLSPRGPRYTSLRHVPLTATR